jgi:hypothetical protein
MQRSATTLWAALLAFFLGFALTLGAQTSGAPQFSTTSINATVGLPLTASLNATNSPNSYNGNLPDGLNLSLSGNITGTPFVAGNFTVVVSASNNSGTTTANLTITIAKGTPVLVTPPSIVLYTDETLADTSPEDGMFNIAGHFEFEDPSSQPTNAQSVNVVFTPFESDNWDPTTFSVPVSVVALPVYDLDLSANLQQIFEGDPYSEARIRITHNGTTSRAITVNFTATSPSLQGDMSGDLTFVDFPASVTIPAGSNSTVFYVRAIDDQSYTGNGNITLTGAGRFLGSNTYPVTLTVLDDETSLGSWSNNSSSTPQLLLQSYAIGGSVHGQPGEPPFLTMNSTHAALDAIIRTNDPALRITGEYTTDLKNGPWTEVTLSLHSDQDGLTDGFERQFFSIPIQATETKKFLRLKIELQE